MNNDTLTNAGDATSVTIIAAAWMNWLPTVATILSIIWFLVRVLETESAQMLLRRVGLAWMPQKPDVHVAVVKKEDEK